MGGGDKKPNTPTIRKRTGGLLDADGGLGLSCPDSGTAKFEPLGSSFNKGDRGFLRLDGSLVVVMLDGGPAGIAQGEGIAHIAKCLADGFEYAAKVELDRGETRVRYWTE